MTTSYDIALRSNAEVWRSIRGRRAAPPVPPGDDQRTATFQSALEQAEQQFRAAALIDFDSRALNLYYGLSQAGRAIAAASSVLPDDGWRLKHHGLSVNQLDSIGPDIAAVEVKTVGKEDTSFRRLSIVLSSDQPAMTTVGDVWPLIYDTSFEPQLGHMIYPPLAVNPQPPDIPSGSFVAQSATIELPLVLLAVPPEDRPALRDYLSRYPALADFIVTTPPGSAQGWPGPNMGLALRWTKPDDLTIGNILDERLTTYRGSKLAYPTLDGATHTVHPLMAWWMVLFSLSMLTRYQPDVWTEMIDVNRSAHATAIEFVLETALSAVPDLIDEAIDQVHQP